MRPSILATAIAVLATWLSAQQAGQDPTDADWKWFGQVRDRALDQFMPMAAGDALVAFRSFHDIGPGVAERHFSIRYAHGGVFDKDKLGATVVTPIGPSVQGQLLTLHMGDRSASFESLLPRISVRSVTVYTATCKALPDRMDRLSKVRISLPERDTMFFDPLWYRVVVNLGGKIDANLADPNNPLARWAAETMDSLLKCAAEREKAASGVNLH
jgi:hypothetical protein